MELYTASYLVSMADPPVAGGALVVEDGRILATGSLGDLRRLYPARVVEFPGCVIVPGLVNAHTHLELTHFPSWKFRKGIDYSPRTYVDWVIQVIKIRRALTDRERELSVQEGVRICLVSGTTSIGEILSDRRLGRIYGASPLAGRIYYEALGRDDVQNATLLENLSATLGDGTGGDLLPGLSPHAPHTVSPFLLAGLVQLASTRGIPLAVHLAESPEETEFLHDTSGRIAELLYPFVGWEEYLPPPLRTSGAAILDAHGVLTPQTAVVHCVHVTPADTEILRSRGVTAVLCPRSNDRLAVGKAPVYLLKKCGIPLALGTDSLASNDSLSLWDEMRFLRHQFPGVFSPEEVLSMGTAGGARAIGMAKEAGTLEPGKRADFLVMKANTSSASEVIEAVIEAGELQQVFIGGKRL